MTGNLEQILNNWQKHLDYSLETNMFYTSQKLLLCTGPEDVYGDGCPADTLVISNRSQAITWMDPVIDQTSSQYDVVSNLPNGGEFSIA